MIMDVALSIVLDIEFMNDYYNVSIEETIDLTYDEKSIDSIFDIFHLRCFSNLFKKISYDPDTACRPFFTNAEVKFMHHIIQKCYTHNMTRYEQFVEVYRRSYILNKDYIGLESTGAESIWDAKNYSLIKIFDMIYDYIMYARKPSLKINPTNYIGICNIDRIPIGHIFLIHSFDDSRRLSYTLEALGIQQSFTTLLIASKTQIKYHVSKKLFDNLITHPLYKNASYMFAYAWANISDILVKYYDFTAVLLKFCLKTKTECEIKDIKYFQNSKPVDLHEFTNVDPGNYIFTYKKITTSDENL